MAEEAVQTQAPAFRPRFRAKLRYARIAPRKLRYAADLIRGKDYNSAVAILRSTPKRGAMFCKKVLESAMSNATKIISSPDTLRKKREIYPPESLAQINVDNLHVVEIRVDPGPIVKRWRPSSQRRPTMIKKRFSHLEIVLQEREPRVSKKEKAKQRRRPKGKGPEAPAAPAQPAEGAAPRAEKKPAPSSKEKKK